RDRGKKSGSKFATGGGGGGIPPPLPPSSGSSVGSSGSTSGNTSTRTKSGGGTASGGGGNNQTQEKKERHLPPPPNRWLYHVWNGKAHAATTDPGSYPDEWKRETVGLIYNYPEKGTDPDPIPTEDGSYWIFAEQFGDTDPDVSRFPLYKMTKGDEWFYVAGTGARDHWRFEWGWSASRPLGYVGR
ncbi:MAG: hypothetical protein KY391_06770, partial [Actinobacteria bacterium]|nr:hypothetical protein [Actinomycetota bacterium]